MAWAATCLDVLPMLAALCGAFLSTIYVYLFWPTEWEGPFNELSWLFCNFFADTSWLFFLATVAHLFMSMWVARSLRSVRQDRADISQRPED